MRIQGNKLTDKKTGCVLEFVAADVATTPGQVTWKARRGQMSIAHSTENWINDGATPAFVGLSAITGAFTQKLALPALKQGQGFIVWLAAEFAGNQNFLKIGGTGALTDWLITLKRNGGTLQDPDADTLDTAAFTADFTGLSAFIALVYDPSESLPANQLTAYHYDLSGVSQQDPVAGTETGTFRDNEDITFNATETVTIQFTESATYNIATCGMVYFDTKPTDLLTGLSAMATDIDSGCYSAWLNL